MSKSFIRVVAIVLAVVTILIPMSLSAWAEELDTPEPDPEIEEFASISTYNAHIEKSGISVTCSASLTAKYSTSLKIVMVLQKHTSDGYTNVKTWTKTGNGIRLSMEESRTINILYTYRLKVTFTADGESYTAYAYY